MCGLQQRRTLIVDTSVYAMEPDGESEIFREGAEKVSGFINRRDTAREQPLVLTSQREDAVEPPRFGEIHFVNMSHPGDVRPQMTGIRRFLMRGSNQQRRPHGQSSYQGQAQEVGQEVPLRIHPGSDNRSPGRSLPPLGSFPVPGDTRTLELVRFGKT